MVPGSLLLALCQGCPKSPARLYLLALDLLGFLPWLSHTEFSLSRLDLGIFLPWAVSQWRVPPSTHPPKLETCISSLSLFSRLHHLLPSTLFCCPGLVRNPFCCSAPRQEPRLPTFLLHHCGRVGFYPTHVASFLQDGCHRSSLPVVCQAEEGLVPATLISFIRKAEADFHLSLWLELSAATSGYKGLGRMFDFSRL